MRVTEVRIDAWLSKSVFINRAYVRKNSRGAVRIIRGTILRIDKTRGAAGNTVAALGPGPPNRVAHGDVDRVRYEHIAALPYRYIDNLAGSRWNAIDGRPSVLVDEVDFVG